MKNIVLKIVTVFLIIGAAINLCAFVSTPYIDITRSYQNLSEKEFVDKLAEKDWKELVDEINVLSDNGSELNDFIYHGSILAEKIDEISYEELNSIIEDEKTPLDTRIVLTQLFKYKTSKSAINDKSVERLVQQLFKKNTEPELKINILLSLPPSEETFAILETAAVFEDDEDVAYQALRRLDTEAPKTACRLADDIIKNEIQGERLRMALMVKSKQYREESASRKEKDAFISLCLGILKDIEDELTKGTKDELMVTSIGYSLADMKDEKAIYEVIENDKFDNLVKLGCVEQNYMVLLEILENNPSENQIDLVIKAMNINPLEPVYTKLQQMTSKYRGQLELTELKIQEPHPANEKWLEY